MDSEHFEFPSLSETVTNVAMKVIASYFKHMWPIINRLALLHFILLLFFTY